MARKSCAKAEGTFDILQTVAIPEAQKTGVGISLSVVPPDSPDSLDGTLTLKVILGTWAADSPRRMS